MRTELVWDGKYDEYGRRREVDAAGLSMPLQKIETVDEPRQRAESQGQLTMFEKELAGNKRDDFRNHLVWGDNKLVMASLLADFKGKIDLIYIDPPFDVGADFKLNIPIGDEKETIAKDQSTLEMVSYRDMWGKGTDSYLHMMFERLSLMKDLLSEKGSIYVHCDYRVKSIVIIAMDEVFGNDGHRNEIVWCYKSGGVSTTCFAKKHDTIYCYAKTGASIFNPQKEKSYMKPWSGKNPAQTYFNYDFGTYTLVNTKDWWTDIGMLSTDAYERVDYPTQKPEPLLERIIKASSNEGDLVADFFCGSGTTGAVAERLGRRWIMSDFGRFAIHTTRKRLIELQRKLHTAGQPYRAFDVHNLGRYERQWWQQDRLKGAE